LVAGRNLVPRPAAGMTALIAGADMTHTLPARAAASVTVSAVHVGAPPTIGP
jgi:hypothetical protein